MLLEALLHQLDAVARSHPVLMVFEDAHWIDPTSRELIDLMIDRLRRMPVLLIITFRSEFQPAWGGQPHVTTLALNRLGARDVAALVHSLAGNAPLGTEFIEEIVDRTDGVPLFIEELTKAVLERADQADRVAAVLSVSPLPALAVPSTLHASLTARLDRIGAAAKEVAQIGAVLGREFSYELIKAVAQRNELELQASLARLTDAGLLFCRGSPPHASYLFKHALVQDVGLWHSVARAAPGAACSCRGRAGAAFRRSRRAPTRIACSPFDGCGRDRPCSGAMAQSWPVCCHTLRTPRSDPAFRPRHRPDRYDP